MQSAKKIFRLLIIITVLALVGYFFFLPLLNKSGTDPENTPEDAQASVTPKKGASLPVKVQPARFGEIIIRISATGLTKPIRQITFAPKVSGDLLEVPLYEGKRVNKGDLLLRLDAREHELALADARSALLKAQGEFGIWNYSRARKSAPPKNTPNALPHPRQNNGSPAANSVNGGVPDSALSTDQEQAQINAVIAGKHQTQVSEATTGLSQARTGLARAQLKLSYCKICAPFSGIIGNLKVAPDQYVTAGFECFQLLDLSEIKVAVGVLENEVGFLVAGRQAAVTFPAFPGEIFHGTVETINPLVDPETKTCRVTVRLKNPQYKIKAGMFAYVKLDAKIFKKRFIVPKTAILLRDNRKLLFIVRDKLAKWSYVSTGLENENFVEILDSKMNLLAGEAVIIEGHYTLVHDAPVRVVEK